MQREGRLLSWQWSGYAEFHRDRLNLLIHVIVVPIFIAGVLATVMQSFNGLWFGALISLSVAGLAFALQAAGHGREVNAPIPFADPADFIKRLFAEQFITFPRFVLSGQWAKNLAESN